MMYFAVGGFMGTGKTTLARNISQRLGWAYVPSRGAAKAFLDDLFKDSHRWAFEAQAAFLVEKVAEARSLLTRSRSVILDRSLDEDVEVFARHFAESGALDHRSAATFRDLATLLQSELGPPDLLIVCQSSFETALRRIHARASVFPRYPPGHLETIAARYQSWLETCPYPQIVAIDTEQWDLRIQSVIDTLLEELRRFFSRAPTQPDLFESAPAAPFSILREVRSQTAPGTPLLAQSKTHRLLSYPSAYVAAPFSSVASPPTDDTLFGTLAPHGVIPDGDYRRILLKIERSIKALGLSTFLPHRDVNAWGRIRLRPVTAARLCTDHVEAADLLVGILGTSLGAHYECGVAIGLGKPVIVVRCHALPDSFIGSGLSDRLPRVHVIECDDLHDVPRSLGASTVRDFLARYIPIREE